MPFLVMIPRLFSPVHFGGESNFVQSGG